MSGHRSERAQTVSEDGDARRWRTLVCLSALAHGLLTFALSLTRFYTGKVAIVDLGAFDQAIWTALHDGTPTTTIYPPYEVATWFGYHFSPIAFVMVPVYAVLSSPELLLALQSALIAVAAVPVFWTCQTILNSPRLAFGWTMLYLLNPFVVSAGVWDFHEKSFAVLAVALGYYAVVSRKRPLFLLSMFVLVLCREHYGFAVAGFAGLWIHTHGYDRTSAAVASVGILAVPLILLVVMPAFNPAGSHPMMGTGTGLQAPFSWMGQSMPAVTATAAQLALQGASYLAVWLVTTGGTSLLAPAFLLPGVADLAANLLSENPMLRSLSAYHSMALGPVFVIAAAQGSRRLKKRALAFRLGLAPTLLLLYQLAPAPLPGSRNPWQITTLQFRPDPSIAKVRGLLDDMAVSAQANVGSFFSQRHHVYRLPAGLERADAVVLHLDFPFDPPRYAPFSNPYDPSEMPGVFQSMAAVIDAPDFGLRYWENNWLVAIRGVDDVVEREAPRRRLAALMAAYDRSP